MEIANIESPAGTEMEKRTSPGYSLDKAAIYVRFESRISRIALTDLIYVEAQKDYVELNTATQSFRILGSMKRIAAELGDVDFFRAHRSFIIRLDKIVYIEGENMQLAGAKELVPVGPSYRSPLLKSLRVL